MKEKSEIDFRIYISAAVLIFAIVLGSYIGNFADKPVSSDSGTWGTFGDFIGGTLNPVLAFLSFVALLKTISIQTKELKASREELEMTRNELARSADAQKEQSESIKLQNFENTFFNMINLHIEITNNISIDKNLKLEYKKFNRDKVIITSLRNKDDFTYVKGKEGINRIVEMIDNFKANQRHYRMFDKEYDLCHNTLQEHIGHYFGNIYQILKFISNNDFVDQKKYANLFRAQFSSSELRLLFYHCTGEIGSKKFKSYLEEFYFLEHLVVVENKIFKFILGSRIYNPTAFGNKERILNEIERINKENTKKMNNLLKEEEKDERTIFSLIEYYAFTHNYDEILLRLKKESESNYVKTLINDTMSKLPN